MEKPSHKIAIGVATTLITAIILRVTIGFTFGGLFRWIGGVIGACWDFAKAPIQIWAWLLILLILLSVILLYLAGNRFYRLHKEPSSDDYVKDSFDGLTWRWGYSNGGGIRDVWCYCPSCDGVLSYSQRGVSSSYYNSCKWATDLHCDHCNRRIATLDGVQSNIVRRIERLIDRKIRVGEWRDVVEQDRLNSEQGSAHQSTTR